MSRLAIDPDQNWSGTALRRLQCCRKFERVSWKNPVVMVAGGDQRRWITFSLHDILKWRVFDQIPESGSCVRGSIVRLPCPANRKLLKPEHIKHTDLRSRSSKELRMLSENGADQQSTVGSSRNG